jgi:hypothetical protein
MFGAIGNIFHLAIDFSVLLAFLPPLIKAAKRTHYLGKLCLGVFGLGGRYNATLRFPLNHL